MARSTGPLLAIGAIRVLNDTIVNGQPMDWKVPLGIGVVAVAFSGAESIPGAAGFVSGVAWIGLVAIVLTRSKGQPSPAENFGKWVGYTK